MIDLHCHLLAGIDDGPALMEESLEMCRMAASDGIETIVATPHFYHDVDRRGPEVVPAMIETLQAALRKEKIVVEILPGADVLIYPDLTANLSQNKHLTINGKGRYVLLEFPHASVPANWEAYLKGMVFAGVVPVITHPERNGWFVRHPEAFYKAVNTGALIQITAMSILGEFGDEAQETSLFLLKHNLAHVIATDAHSVHHRPPVLSEAVKAASSVVGEDNIRPLVTTIPAAIIEGKPVRLPVPLDGSGRKSGWLDRFFGGN